MLKHRNWWLVALLLAAGGLLVWFLDLYFTQPRVVVTWETASELETAGFNLYRSTSPEGPFTQINENLLSAQGDPVIGSRYVFTDTQVVAGEWYYYELQEVELDGKAFSQGMVSVRATSGSMITTVVSLLLFIGSVLWLVAGLVVRRKAGRSVKGEREKA
ncbi:MAG: hypothetical protein AB1345_04575 [Chloroflexota bacterium]